MTGMNMDRLRADFRRALDAGEVDRAVAIANSDDFRQAELRHFGEEVSREVRAMPAEGGNAAAIAKGVGAAALAAARHAMAFAGRAGRLAAARREQLARRIDTTDSIAEDHERRIVALEQRLAELESRA